MLFYQESFINKNMNDINEKLDTIIDFLNKVLEKQTSTVSFGNFSSNSTNLIGKAYKPNTKFNFPKPCNCECKPVNP